ncbi:histidine kinase [Rheinheimera sp. KL1]|uniref:GAF domain-containing protein n=1 Tax=Rheinheimera sp. KL1 TaxID=1635005 RepID=UPI0006A9D48F|nr:histidine kinase [Rheinheimera sp. KL1]KOO59508.1 histidine kinase [Rheinheimera sp. KL1]
MAEVSINLYLEQTGLAALLEGQETAIEQAVAALKTQLAAASAPAVTWSYQVPELGEGGACSLFGQLADEPYDLAATLGKSEATTKALSQLTAVVKNYQQSNDSDWFGIYQKRQNPQGDTVLVKLAYFGAASRAEFPLTAEFAQISNNSTVGLTGKAKVINDVTAYLTAGGEYYTCDPKVLSEACLPLFNSTGELAGIIDAEAFKRQAYHTDALVRLVAICLVLPDLLPA